MTAEMDVGAGPSLLSDDASPPLTAPAFELRGLRKVYGSRVAVHGLDLIAPRGRVVGLLGPNGAGKTTVIKMILGLVQPTAGTVTILGHPNTDPGARTRVGFLPEHFRFHDWLTAHEFLDFHGQLYGMSAETRRARIPHVLARVGLQQRADGRLRTFSKGMLQRIGLAQALLNEPELLILDEPTSGLDPVGRREVRDLIAELREAGVTVLLNSHILSEVESVCDEIAILDLGRLVWSGRPDEVALGRIQVVARVGGFRDSLLPALRAMAPDLEAENGVLRFQAPGDEAVADVAQALVAGGVRLYRLETRQTSLEDLFISLVEGRDT
jgi:ABC-2 type transport system ATP-binding protein